MRVAALAVALGLAAGCRGSSHGASGSGSAAPASAPADGLRIVVDDAVVATVPDTELTGRRPLATLVPVAPAAWRAIEADADGGRTLTASRLDATHPGEDAIVYLDHGAPAFGFFRRAQALPPNLRDLAGTPTLALSGVREIRVRTRPVTRAPLPPQHVVLCEQPREKGHCCTLDADQLARVAPLADAHAHGERAAWDVHALTAACFAGRPLRAVRAGSLSIDAAALARADQRVQAKLNRRGHLVVRVVSRPGGRMLAQAQADEIDVELE